MLCAFWIAGAIVAFAPSEGSGAYYLLLATAAPAMGMQNATLRRVGGTPVHTTFVTGVLTNISQALAGVVASRIVDGNRNRDAEHVLAVLTPVYAAYLAGGLAAAVVFLARPSLAPPVALVPLAFACLQGVRRDPLRES